MNMNPINRQARRQSGIQFDIPKLTSMKDIENHYLDTHQTILQEKLPLLQQKAQKSSYQLPARNEDEEIFMQENILPKKKKINKLNCCEIIINDNTIEIIIIILQILSFIGLIGCLLIVAMIIGSFYLKKK